MIVCIPLVQSARFRRGYIFFLNVGVLEVQRNIKKMTFIIVHPWCFKMVHLKLFSIVELMSYTLQMKGLLLLSWNFTLLGH